MAAYSAGSRFPSSNDHRAATLTAGVAPEMKVCHVLAYLSAKYGGPPIVAENLAVAMRKYDVQTVWRATGNDADRDELRRLGSAARIFDTAWPKRWYRSPDLANALRREIGSFDLLHLHEIWSYPQYISARIGNGEGKPHVITVHGELEPWRVNSKRMKKRLYLLLVLGRMLNQSACLHAITASEVAGFREAGYRGPVAIVPSGIDPGEFSDLPDALEAEERWPDLKNKRVVHFLSRLSREKGLDQFLPAWGDVVKKKSYEDCILVLSGPNDRGYGTIVEQLIEELGLAPSVFLTGMVRSHEKMALISRSDIYALPSYSEGFSMSLLENLNAGKPVLITPGCNFPEVESAGAGLCVPPEREALANGLMQLLDMSTEDRKAMGLRGRHLVLENYTWDKAARKLITVYDCILKGKDIPLHPEPIPLDTNGKAIL
jgi:glycosyltransferase involved in cell wall biosynthesis